ncbi:MULTISPECIES: ribosome maturation factor RimM [Salimicrobium]|uniref:Ribosome maturation factor RimM n=1 Tax=Salimicrobium humidisoli TaxID=2029857 RepID=A0ABX4HRN3_9BACI|nr:MULTISPECIES: ribosome maturation factor RimM [Salimicrobium]PBB05849.1 ribosome maturation factor RimM [Salimicrobium humidisoli]
METEYLNVGRIINTHGIKGEVKIKRITDFEERFREGNTLYWSSGGIGEVTELTVESHRIHKGFDLLKFRGYPTINEVEPLKNGMLMIHKGDTTPLGAEEYYFHEIIGCHVYTTAGHYVGEVKEIMTPGANDVWVIDRKEEGDALIPYIEDVVVQVDVSKKSIIIEPMEGLLD